MTCSLVFLSGGKGTRFPSKLPKQYLMLKGSPLFSYSLQTLIDSVDFEEIIIVCDPSYREQFDSWMFDRNLSFSFAKPGDRRQDSVKSGVAALQSSCSHVMVHDAARPFVNSKNIKNLFKVGLKVDAAALSVPVSFTVKGVDANENVTSTFNRDYLREVQTPQIVKKSWLEEGISLADKRELTVTDDVAFAEMLGHKVQLVEGSYDNTKVTTQEDFILVKALLDQKSQESVTV
jgi:2-C-methyl-D-erythritol 4-phosphate cytidylyltransferase